MLHFLRELGHVQPSQSGLVQSFLTKIEEKSKMEGLGNLESLTPNWS